MALQPWSLASVTANVETDLVVPAANKEVAVVGLVIVNYSTTATAAVEAVLTSSVNVRKGYVFKASLSPGENVFLDTKVFLAASATPDKIRVLSDQASVSFIASGDAS
jgi:hypothetical protein